MSIDQVAVNNEAASDAENAAFLAEMAEPIVDAKAPTTEGDAGGVQKAGGDTGADEQTSNEVKQEARVEVIPGFTAEELKEKLGRLDALQKAIDTTNGTYGARLDEQQKRLEELAQQRQQAIGGISKEKLARLGAEYPEIAEMLAEDLADIIGSGGWQNIDPVQIEQQVLSKAQAELEAKLRQSEQAREIRSLTKRHNDWREIAMFSVQGDGAITWNNPDFGRFVQTLPEHEQRQMVESFDADFVAEKLSAFKESKSKSGSQKSKQQMQLSAAVLPQGSGGREVASALDEEEEAFRREMAS